MNGPHGVSFEFRYSVYLPVMGYLWDFRGNFVFPYYGA